jgi:hypothetical protein
MVRIRSEHAIGFLKGCFQSLKELRIAIRDEASHKFATYWILAAIAVHCFALTVEAEERGASNADEADPFIAEGIALNASAQREQELLHQHPHDRRRGLVAAKARREQLKHLLFQAKRCRREAQRDISDSE